MGGIADHPMWTLFEVEPQRHPMWTYTPNPLMQRHREVALRALARELVRFDGTLKPTHDWDNDIIDFCQRVHAQVVMPGRPGQSSRPDGLMGSIVLIRIRRVEALTRRLDANLLPLQPITKEMTRRSINVITGLSERFVQAIAKEAAPC